MENQKIEQIVTEELNRYDMELPNYEYDTVTTRITERIVKLFAIPDVINRRELLIAFNKEMSELHSWFLPAEDSMIDEFLSNK